VNAQKSDEPVRIERDGRRAVLTLERVPLNILDLETIATLDGSIDRLASEPPQLLIVRSGIPGTFSAGVSVQDHTPDKIDAMLDGFHGALNKLRALPGITLADVRGRCLGGGMELAMACDLVFASESATFSQPEIELGCFPPYAAALYPRRIGSDRALRLLVTGETLTALEAEAIGLVTESASESELDSRIDELSCSILAKSARVVELTKRAVRSGVEQPFDEGLAETERIYRRDLGQTEDLREGIAAFLEKRRPDWRHR